MVVWGVGGIYFFVFSGTPHGLLSGTPNGLGSKDFIILIFLVLVGLAH
jgi:hypothetical protein